jgi:hypothetical protein
MSAFIKITNGKYRTFTVHNKVLQLVADYNEKGGYVTVVADDSFGDFADKQIRVKVASMEDIVPANASEAFTPEVDSNLPSAEKHDAEYDATRLEEIAERFEILEDMTEAAIEGTVRAMIVVGPPGVGKSFGVERTLEKAAMFDKIANMTPRFEVVKGAMSPIGLYCKLFQYADAGNVLVFDDCDSVLMDDLSLNILKAALDSSKKRIICWNTDSSMLRREGVPDRFEFKGSAIFITNIKFEHVRSAKLKDHLSALESRCHYLDLTLDSAYDKMLRIKQIMRDGMLNSYNFSEAENKMIYDYVETNQDRLRELSLRTVIKVADLCKMTGVDGKWKRLAETTVMKRSF